MHEELRVSDRGDPVPFDRRTPSREPQLRTPTRSGEISPIEVDGETCRRVQVTFPDEVKTHTRQQNFCFGTDGLLRRHDSPLVLLSPWPESILAYWQMWEQLAANFSLTAIDLPGFGDSESRADLMQPRSMGDFVVRAGEALGLDRLPVAGDEGLATFIESVDSAESRQTDSGPLVAAAARSIPGYEAPER